MTYTELVKYIANEQAEACTDYSEDCGYNVTFAEYVRFNRLSAQDLKEEICSTICDLNYEGKDVWAIEENNEIIVDNIYTYKQFIAAVRKELKSMGF